MIYSGFVLVCFIVLSDGSYKRRKRRLELDVRTSRQNLLFKWTRKSPEGVEAFSTSLSFLPSAALDTYGNPRKEGYADMKRGGKHEDTNATRRETFFDKE
jgi:hypothetical protein